MAVIVASPIRLSLHDPFRLNRLDNLYIYCPFRFVDAARLHVDATIWCDLGYRLTPLSGCAWRIFATCGVGSPDM